MTTTQEALAAYFESESERCDIQAQAHPNDLRPAQAARSLLELGTYALSLPDDDPAIEAVRGYLAVVHHVPHTEQEVRETIPAYVASHLGFGEEPINLAAMLHTYVETGLASQLRRREQAGDPSAGDLLRVLAEFEKHPAPGH